MSIREITRLQRIKDKADLDEEISQIKSMKKPMHPYNEPSYINYDDEVTNANRQADEYALLEMRASIAATPKGLTTTMNKKLDRPTEEMIQQYNQQHQRKPYVDPESGRLYKYHPVEAEPILEQLDEEQLERVIPENVIARANNEIRYATLTRAPEIEREIKNINERKKEIRDEIDSMPLYQPSEGKISVRREHEKDLLVQRHLNDLDELDYAKGELEREMEEIIQGVANFEQAKQISIRNKISNEGKINLVQQQNKQKLKAYKEQLNVLNSGAFNMEQMPYETDEEFKERLIAHSQIEAPAEALYDATVYASKEIRNKLKELIRNDVIIDLIANRITPQDKYAIMKSWGAYKKKFIETFGTYNPAMSVDDLVDFLTSPIGSNKQKDVVRALNEEEKEADKQTKANIDIEEAILGELPQLEEEELFILQNIDNTLEITLNKPNKRRFYIKLINATDTGRLKVVFSLEQAENTFISKKKSTIETFLRNECYYTKEEITLFFQKFGNTVSEIKNNLLYSMEEEKPYGIIPQTGKKIRRNEEVYDGWGIKHENIPEWVPFGSILINLKKLYYDNLLSIKSHAHHAISGFVVVPISNKFVSIIMELIRGKTIHYREIEELSRNEIELYDHLIALAKLHKKLDHRISNSTKELKNRYEILVGEIEAGNNNPNIKKELKITVSKLVSLKVLTQNDAKHFLKQL